MVLKSCTKCLVEKSLNNFSQDKRVSHGYKSWCRDCCAVYYSQYRSEHKERTKAIRKRYRKDWTKFFIEEYGQSVSCAVCDKNLLWNNITLSTTPHFDHRMNGQESIQGPPAAWWGGHACTLENQKTWLECNFGILCGKCNSCLPTYNRGEWLQKALEYYDKTETSIIN